MAKTRGDTLTGDLLSWEPEPVSVGFDEGQVRGNRMANRISQAVALALKSSELGRAEIAARMSDELGYPVSEATLDAYASEAKESHRITLERFIALIEVTGCHDLLGFVAEFFGFRVVPQKYADLIELHLLEEHERDVTARKQALQARWRGTR
ncbi:hypothetical protein C8N35_10298 [Breoghania corrubedonensis]|uniref:Uncharacterized protein n=1 Tax=Breoghania corrubedonensis TaxID=665038 RepID=A0A2T5VCA4_9HYPH|nr:hypothetical protein [Breoghania corrubedonensis]PTW61389.1 hypothetical protein C8N35_10298 [Breoghania corrubedonensis]